MTRSTRNPAPLLLCLAAAACGGDATGVDPITSLPRDLSVAERELVAASNDFAVELLRRVPPNPDTPNVFLSPLSASMALGMTMNGAAGDTWTGMRDALGFATLDEPAINQAYRDLLDLLVDLDPDVTLAVGNSVWGDRTRITFRDDFLQRVRTWFDAEARAVDFGDPATLDAINDWASAATQGRIDPLLDNVPPGIVAYLINAVYFDADWTQPFDRDRTRPAPFQPEAGGPVEVQMMEGEVGRLVLGAPGGSGVTGVALPYGGGAFQGIALLPPEGVTVREFLGGVDAATWDGWMASLDEQAESATTDAAGLLVRLPKFEIEWGALLNDPLRDMGMSLAFDAGQADFSRLAEGAGPGDLFISEVLQKTYVRVDEEGTEAAAVTSVGIGVTSAPPSLTFDRPFLFAIRERFSGTVLFVGIIGDPTR